MELLVEAVTFKNDWNREQFLESRSDKTIPMALLKFNHSREPIESFSDDGIMQLNPEDYATEAASRLRQTYPTFTMQVAKKTGLIDLYIWQNQISWWWFLPFSEKSSLRTPMVELLYWFCILEIVLEKHQFVTVHLITDSAEYGHVLQELCQKYHAKLGKIHYLTHNSENGIKLTVTFLYRFLYRTVVRSLTWAALKWYGFDSLVNYQKIGAKSIIFCTFYPAFFEKTQDSDLLNEKLFGTWPNYLKQKGYSIVYGTTIAFGFRNIIKRAKQLKRHVVSNNIVIWQSLWSLSDLLKITLNFTFPWRYWWWRKRISKMPLLFRGIDIRTLVLQELDQDVFFRPGAAPSIGLCYAVEKLLKKLGGASGVCHTFEYQPRERAIAIGVRTSGKTIPAIGFQVSMFSFNHLPWFFPKEETQPLHNNQYDVRLAPLPDYLVAYGRADYGVFSQQLSPDKVILAGPIRYAQLAYVVRSKIDAAAFRKAHDIPADATLLLLATSITRPETLLMIQMVLKVIASFPKAYLLVKFHPHLPMSKEFRQIANNVGFSDYQIFDANLNMLIKASKAMILSSSAVGIEAIALDCMPIVFYSPGGYEAHPLRDFPEAAFFCQNGAELKSALAECVSEGSRYQQCKTHWPRVIESLLYRLDGRENERLYEALKSKGVL